MTLYNNCTNFLEFILLNWFVLWNPLLLSYMATVAFSTTWCSHTIKNYSVVRLSSPRWLIFIWFVLSGVSLEMSIKVDLCWPTLTFLGCDPAKTLIIIALHGFAVTTLLIVIILIGAFTGYLSTVFDLHGLQSDVWHSLEDELGPRLKRSTFNGVFILFKWSLLKSFALLLVVIVILCVIVRMGRGKFDVWFIYCNGDYTHVSSILKSFSGAIIHEDVLGCLFDLQETLKKKPNTAMHNLWDAVLRLLSSEEVRLIALYTILAILITIVSAMFAALW
jgi:hypothetical protein